MFQHKAASLTIAAIAVCVAMSSMTLAEEYRPGDQVVALRDAELKVENATVGTVQKGDKVAVEQVQGNWVWVRSGDVAGWIDSRSVLAVKVQAWYDRTTKNFSVEESGRTRAKLDSVRFEIIDAGSIPARVTVGDGMVVRGREWGAFADAAYGNVRVFVERVSNLRRELSVRFNPPQGVLEELPPPLGGTKGDLYGTVEPGDYVFISPSARQVFVNGQLRKPK